MNADANKAAQPAGSAGASAASETPTVATSHGDVGAVAGIGGSSGDGVSDEDGGLVVPDAPSHESASACVACRNESCRNYQGHDLVAGCLERLEPSYAADPNDPNFVKDCSAVVECVHVSDCSNQGFTNCYCGSVSNFACLAGAMRTGSCVTQIEQAARSSGVTDLEARNTDLGYPLGWATKLLECERKLCGDVCGASGATVQ